MNYAQAREYMESINQYGSVLGLENIRELLGRLGNPQEKLSLIHVAGTNGKGSVVSYLSTIYSKAGYQVGRYVSPTICKYRERIQINQRYIEKEEFAEGITIIKEIIEEMVAEQLPHPTPFEVETALAVWYFEKKKCQMVILECGMGGSLDATNVMEKKICTVFASISRDHMGFLGETLEEIAKNKAGIMRKGVPAVSMAQSEPVKKVLMEKAKKEGVPLFLADVKEATILETGIEKQRFSYDNYENIEISLAGIHQISNAVLALKVIEVLKDKGFPISKEAVYEGFAQTKWVGRFTTIYEQPRIIVDGAHNEDAAKKLAESIRENLKGKRVIFLMGVFKDKEYEKIVEHTAVFASQIITFTIPENERALNGLELAYAVRKYNENVTAADSLKEALDMALLFAEKEDVIIAFGSLSFIGKLMELTEDLKKKEAKSV